MGLIGKLKDKGRRFAMGKILGIVLTWLAEGKFGSGPQKLWLWLQGKKTIIAGLLATIAAALQAAQANGTCALVEGHKLFGWAINCGEAASALLWLSGILALVGLTDGALRMDPPKAPQPKANDARGFSRPLALVGLAALSLLLLSACGEDPLPVAPDPVPTMPAIPAQSVIRLSMGVTQGDGGRVEEIKRDSLYYVEAAPVCSDPALPCPPLTDVAWGVSGAFCEMLGGDRDALRPFICRDLGIAEIRAVSGTATGSVRVRIVN